MKTLSLVVAVLLAAVILIPTSAEARLEPDNHSGFYIGLALGVGSVSVKVDDFESDAESSGAGQLRLGGALSQTILLGVESNAWVKEYQFFNETTTWTLSNVAATVTFYPTNYFFLKGGPALGVVEVEFKPASGFTFSDNATGGGFMLGAGGELRLTEKFALIPAAQFMWQRFTADFGFGEEEFDVSFFSITFGVGWFW